MVRFAILSLCLLAGVAPNRAAADVIYLAVGDSSAFGETDRTRNPSNGDRGYVAPFADYLAGQNGGIRPTVINTAVNGETTKSFFTGQVSDRASTDGITLNSNYSPFAPNYPSQQAYMIARIEAQLAAGNTIKTVTVQLGANDLSNTAEAPDFLGLTPGEQQLRIADTLNAIAQNYAALLTELRGLLPNADLYTIGYHNPYGGSPEHPFYTLAAPALQALNSVIGQVGTAFGGTYVDFYTPILSREHELTLVDRFPGDLINYVHLNDAGYQVESQQLIRTATPTPAPPGAVLAGVGVVLLGARRWVRKKRASVPLAA